MDAVFSVPEPRNEPVRNYAPGSAERDRLAAAARPSWPPSAST